MSRVVVSYRRPSGDPVLEAFTDQTYDWMDELEADFEELTGERFEGGNGILFASDVLVAIHHHDASWARFDVAEFEEWIRKNAPGFELALPSMLADLCMFTSYLARTGRIDPARAIATERRTFEVFGIERPWPEGHTCHPVPRLARAPRNRAERRAARARARRSN